MNKKILSILFLLVFLCAVAHVSAAEIFDDAVASDNSENISLEENADEDMKLSEAASDVLANGTEDDSTEPPTNTTPVGALLGSAFLNAFPIQTMRIPKIKHKHNQLNTDG